MAEIYASTRSIGREQRGAADIEVSRIDGYSLVTDPPNQK